MEWSDIRIFLQVVRQGTMSAATNALRMDHSTISRRISRLEREMRVQIFERAGRRLALTPEGVKLVVAAEKLEAIILRDVMSLSGEGGRIGGPVRLGTTEEFGAHYLAPRLSTLTTAYPELEIELVALPRTFSLATREVDVVVTLDRPLAGDIRYKRLTALEFGVYGTAAYFEHRPRPATMGELRSETWCGYIRELLSTPELDLVPLASGTGSARYRTTSVTAQLAAALSGFALAALPGFMTAAYPQLERILPREAAFERTYWIAVHEDLANYPRIRAVMHALQAQVARDHTLFMPSERGRPLVPISEVGERAAVRFASGRTGQAKDSSSSALVASPQAA